MTCTDFTDASSLALLVEYKLCSALIPIIPKTQLHKIACEQKQKAMMQKFSSVYLHFIASIQSKKPSQGTLEGTSKNCKPSSVTHSQINPNIKYSQSQCITTSQLVVKHLRKPSDYIQTYPEQACG